MGCARRIRAVYPASADPGTGRPPESRTIMTSTSDKRHARAIMARHEGVKYTEALRFVAELKELRERSESREAFGMGTIIEQEPLGPLIKTVEARRSLATDGGRALADIDESVPTSWQPDDEAFAARRKHPEPGGQTGELIELDELHALRKGAATGFLSWSSQVCHQPEGRERSVGADKPLGLPLHSVKDVDDETMGRVLLGLPGHKRAMKALRRSLHAWQKASDEGTRSSSES